MQERDFQFIGRNARIVPANALEAIDERARHFHAGEAAADDDEMAQPLT